MAKSTPQHIAKRTKSSSKSPLVIVLVSLAVLAGLVFLWLLMRNESLQAVDQQETRAEIESVLDQTHLGGTPAYTEVVDRGCDSGSSVGLATYIYCEIAGYKFYKTQEDPSVDLRSVDAALIATGWTRNLLQDQTSQDFQSSLISLSEDKAAQYQRDRIPLTIYQRSYESDERASRASVIDDFIKEGRIPEPAPGEVIYGVDVRATYWSCRHDSFFKLPCPAPPSRPE